MKNLYFTAAIFFLITINTTFLSAQSQKEQVIAMIKEFYSAYITEVSGSNPLIVSEKKLDSLQKTHCTTKLLQLLPDIIIETGADPFLKAQDSNLKCLETLTVKKDLTINNGYIVSYMDVYSKKLITMWLIVVKKGSGFKIDSIK